MFDYCCCRRYTSLGKAWNSFESPFAFLSTLSFYCKVCYCNFCNLYLRAAQHLVEWDFRVTYVVAPWNQFPFSCMSCLKKLIASCIKATPHQSCEKRDYYLSSLNSMLATLHNTNILSLLTGIILVINSRGFVVQHDKWEFIPQNETELKKSH